MFAGTLYTQNCLTVGCLGTRSERPNHYYRRTDYRVQTIKTTAGQRALSGLSLDYQCSFGKVVRARSYSSHCKSMHT